MAVIGRLSAIRLIQRLARTEWLSFFRESPNLQEYRKSYQTPRDLLGKIVDQGLIVDDVAEAESVISSINYYRFKAYFVPFLDSRRENFSTGAKFTEIYALYQHDQAFRDFLFPILAQLEVRIRCSLGNTLTSLTKDPFWYLDEQYFTKHADVYPALDKVGARMKTGTQEFVAHFREHYYNGRSYRYRLLPPFWILAELLTIEQLLSIAKKIDKSVFELPRGDNPLDVCAQRFGFSSYDALTNNLGCILELRNICAHHSRLWNRNLRNPSLPMKQITKKPARVNRLYSHLLMLRIMCKAQGIADDGIMSFFAARIASHATLQRDSRSMGFPENWQADPIWR